MSNFQPEGKTTPALSGKCRVSAVEEVSAMGEEVDFRMGWMEYGTGKGVW